MKTFLKFLSRNKLYSAINLIGLSLSMAFVLLLAVYVQRQLSTDAFHENADRIFVIANEEGVNMGYWMDKHLINNFPEIEKSTAVCSLSPNAEYVIDGELVYGNSLAVDSCFFEMFSYELAKGSKTDWKISWDRCMVSEAFAHAHFGDKDPIGAQITFRQGDEDYPFTVCGVFRDFGNSILKSPDVLCRGEIMTKINQSNNEHMSNAGSSVCFVMTYRGADLQAREADMLAWMRENFWVYSSKDYQRVRMIPLRDMYFLKDGNRDWTGILLFGNRSLVMLLLAMCVVLLLFAVLNYVNLTTALTGFRAKEMAARRLVGASKSGIFWKMMAESTLMCAVAMVLAVFVAQALTPSASEILKYPIDIFKALTPLNLFLTFVLVLVIGLLAGMVPALIIHRVKPIEIVRGTLRFKTKTTYSKVIIVVQNVVTVVMLIAALTMFLQVRSLINAPLGYNTKDMLNISNNYGKAPEMTEFLEKLRSQSFVEEVGLGEGIPLMGTNNWTTRITEEQWCSFQMIKGDSCYFNMLGIRVKQDNHNPNNYWLNEYAFGQLGIDETAGEFKVLRKDGVETMQIGGIYYDFKIFPLLDRQSAALIYNYGEYPDKWPWNILVKINGDHKEAYQKIEALVNEVFPGKLFEAEYVEEAVANCFSEQSLVLKIVGIFALLSLFVSALGLIAMSSYYMQQERRSVALKKVFGAPRRQVLNELVFSFLKMVGIAILIALPIAYFLMKRWLEDFSYKIDLHWWIFVVAGLVVVFVAMLAVLWQSLKAANTNPVEALKKE